MFLDTSEHGCCLRQQVSRASSIDARNFVALHEHEVVPLEAQALRLEMAAQFKHRIVPVSFLQISPESAVCVSTRVHAEAKIDAS